MVRVKDQGEGKYIVEIYGGYNPKTPTQYELQTYVASIGKTSGKYWGSPERLVKYAGQYWENIGTVKNIVTNMQTGEKHTLGKYAPPSPKVLPKSVVIR